MNHKKMSTNKKRGGNKSVEKKGNRKRVKKAENVRMLNILSLVVRSLLHSLSYLECEERKKYHEKMQFAHSIIQDIYRSGTFTVVFLQKRKRGWSSNEQVRELH
jgi:hypothetical protein